MLPFSSCPLVAELLVCTIPHTSHPAVGHGQGRVAKWTVFSRVHPDPIQLGCWDQAVPFQSPRSFPGS